MSAAAAETDERVELVAVVIASDDVAHVACASVDLHAMRLVATGAEQRSAHCEDSCESALVEFDGVILCETAKAIAKTDDLHACVMRRLADASNGCIETRTVAACREDTDAFWHGRMLGNAGMKQNNFSRRSDRQHPTSSQIKRLIHAMLHTHSTLRSIITLIASLAAISIQISFAATNLPAGIALAELTKPTARIAFKDVIAATTKHRVLDFDTNNPAHASLFRRISTAAESALTNARAVGLFSARANEAGNHMESFVRKALSDAQLVARTPVTSQGRAQTTGYPDVEILGDLPCYIELKTYNASTVNTTQRSFYYSPSENPKVTRDALHLLLAYELEKSERDGKTVFTPTHWRLITLQDLQVDLKFEFNQSNRGLYGKDAAHALLGEGNGETKRQ